jgi:hypothetical protein
MISSLDYKRCQKSMVNVLVDYPSDFIIQNSKRNINKWFKFQIHSSLGRAAPAPNSIFMVFRIDS